MNGDECRIITCRHCKKWKQITENTGKCRSLIKDRTVTTASISWCCFADDEYGPADGMQWEVKENEEHFNGS